MQVRGEVEFLVVVNAEGRKFAGLDWHCADAANLRIEEARGHAGHHDQRRQPVIIRYVGANREAGNLRVVPRDRERDRRGAQDAEIVGVVRVFPDVLAIDDEILPESLL